MDHCFRLLDLPSHEEAQRGSIHWDDFAALLNCAAVEGVICQPFDDRDSFTTNDFWSRHLEDLLVTKARWDRARWTCAGEKPSWETILEWVKSNDAFKEKHAITKLVADLEDAAMQRVMELKGARTIAGAGLPSATPEIEAAVMRIAARVQRGVQEIEAARDLATATALFETALTDIAAIEP